MTTKCYDCGISSNDPEWSEAILQDTIRDAIQPEGGILCLTCTRRRLEMAGYTNVKCYIKTLHDIYGPFTICTVHTEIENEFDKYVKDAFMASLEAL